MNLVDLKRPGTRLVDVEPGFRGMPLHEWQRAIFHSMCEELHQAIAAELARKGETPWIERQKISTPRDNYGWRSLFLTNRNSRSKILSGGS